MRTELSCLLALQKALTVRKPSLKLSHFSPVPLGGLHPQAHCSALVRGLGEEQTSSCELTKLVSTEPAPTRQLLAPSVHEAHQL